MGRKNTLVRQCPSCKRKRVRFLKRLYAGDYIAWCRCGKTLIKGYNGRVSIDRTTPDYCTCQPHPIHGTLPGFLRNPKRCRICGRPRTKKSPKAIFIGIDLGSPEGDRTVTRKMTNASH